MRVTDLMVDDWVRKLEVGGHYRKCRIKAIIDNTVDCVTSDGEVHTLSVNEIEPIPLDSKIMNKFGFVCSYDDYHQWYIETNHNTLWLEQSRTEPHTYFMRVFNGLKVRYVHELQHALKLCEIDKNIEL